MYRKWNKVMAALVILYEQYCGYGVTDDGVKHLMEAYDEWLDGGIEHLKGLRQEIE